jgi:hypothetical protein
MSKADPSNLTCVQHRFLSNMIPQPERGGHPGGVDMWEIQ